MHCDLENARDDLIAAKANLRECRNIPDLQETLHLIDVALLSLEEFAASDDRGKDNLH